MTDIEIERGDELYKGRGRVWLEAGSDLGVSRGALAEIGVHGLIDEDAPPHIEGVEPLAPLVSAPGLRDSVRAPLLDDVGADPAADAGGHHEGAQRLPRRGPERHPDEARAPAQQARRLTMP